MRSSLSYFGTNNCIRRGQAACSRNTRAPAARASCWRANMPIAKSPRGRGTFCLRRAKSQQLLPGLLKVSAICLEFPNNISTTRVDVGPPSCLPLHPCRRMKSFTRPRPSFQVRCGTAPPPTHSGFPTLKVAYLQYHRKNHCCSSFGTRQLSSRIQSPSWSQRT